MKQRTSSRLSGDLAILASALLWGTLWIPLRRLHEAGASGALASALGFLMPLAILLPIGLRERRRLLAGGWQTALAGFCLATSIALYAAGLVRGPVARVVLLFYLTPLWSTLLARVALAQPITPYRVASLLLGLTGLLVVLGGEAGLPLPNSVAEWMGLVAGMAWATAMLFVHRSASRLALDRVLAQFVFLAPTFLLISLLWPLPDAATGLGLDREPLLAALPWLLAFALLWMLPVVWLTVFGASRIEPGRVAIFLMLEIAVSLISAAVLAGEALGPRELTGAIFVIAASAVELRAGPRVRSTVPPA